MPKYYQPAVPSPWMPMSELPGYTLTCRSRLYDLVKNGKFPQPLKLGSSSRWVRAEVDAWMQQQQAEAQRGLAKSRNSSRG